LTVTPAAVANTLNGSSTNSTIGVTWAAADASLSQVEFLVAGNVVGTQTIANPATATSATFTLGTATAAALKAAMPTGGAVTVRLVDIAGNSATSAATNLTVDFVAPTVTIGMPAGTITSGQTKTVTFTLSEVATNFALADVAATNGTLGSFTGSGTSYSAVFTPTANFTGSTAVTIAAAAFTDAASNASAAATTVTRTIDTAAPTVTLNRSAATSTINAVTYTLTANEQIDCSTLSTAAGLDFTVTGAALTAIDQTDNLTCTLTATANATRGSPATAVIAKASTFSITDANGNPQTALTVTNGTINVTIPTVAPSAPTNLTGTPAATKALLTWSAPVDTGGSAVTSYVLQKTTVANPVAGDWAIVAAGDVSFAGTSATVSNLTNGTDYYFRVLAVNVAGSSPYSTASAIINPYDVPAAPTVAVTAAANQLNVTITAPATNGRAISAYQWTIDGGLTWTAFSNTNLTQTLTSLLNGNPYSVKVRALNIAGPGAASNSATATPTGPAAAPTITGIAGGNASVVVSFTSPVDNGGAAITNYEYSTNNGTSFTALATPSATSPLTITGLTNGNTYAIKIRAVTSAGVGAASTSVNGYPLSAPSVASAITATPAVGSLVVTFTPGATGGAAPTYTVTATPVGGGTAISAIGSGSPITVSGLSNGVAYTLSVLATNAAGSSPAFTSGANSFTPSGKPSTPQVTNIDTSVANQLTLAFNSLSVGVSMDAWDYKVRLNNNVSCSVVDYLPLTATAFDALPWIAANSGNDQTGSFTATGLTAGSCSFARTMPTATATSAAHRECRLPTRERRPTSSPLAVTASWLSRSLHL
jgi:predicted RNA-binding protein with TRAM domain